MTVSSRFLATELNEGASISRKVSLRIADANAHRYHQNGQKAASPTRHLKL